MSRICKHFIVIAVLAVILVGPAQSKKLTVDLTASAVTAHEHTNAARGNYYTMELAVPSVLAGRELWGAYLEFYVDVTAVERDSTSVRIPVLELYALKSAYSNAIVPSSFNTDTGFLVNVTPGENRRVLVDITDIVKGYVATPSSNHGLIMGALDGTRWGTFALKSNVFPGGTVVKVHYHYDNRETG